MKQKPSKNISHTKTSRLVIFNIAIWTSNLWYTFTFALDYIMDDVINCLHLGVNVVLLDPGNIVEIVMVLRSELEVK